MDKLTRYNDYVTSKWTCPACQRSTDQCHVWQSACDWAVAQAAWLQGSKEYQPTQPDFAYMFVYFQALAHYLLEETDNMMDPEQWEEEVVAHVEGPVV